MSVGLLAAVSLSVSAEEEEVVEEAQEETVQEVEEPKEEVHILSHEELSMLYSCRSEERIEDPNIIEVDYEDAQLLMRIAECEHGDGSPEAQANDIRTVINRIGNESFPGSIREIVFQDHQFSTVKSKKFNSIVPDVDAHIALYLVESGQVVHDALFFESVDVKDSWMSRNREVAFEFEGHRYYR